MNRKSENTSAASLNNLYYFNAHTRSNEDVIKTFIVRKEILQELERGIKNEKKNSIPQHYLIIGTRGMGKSTLLKRLEIRLGETDMKDQYIPLLFPEEQYNVDRISKFWLNSLDVLADTLEQEGNEEEASAIDKLITSLSEMSDENVLADDAYEALKIICQKYKRRPVFLIDNIDLLFEAISKDQQFKLRAILTSNGAPIFVGASTHNPDASLNYEAPFFDAFDIIYLKVLKRSEMRELLIQLAKQTGKEENIQAIYTQTAQLNALHNLTGGNPRIAIFIFQLISNGLSDKIFENLNSLLDLITPLYKSNFEQLSKQAQLIVDALALHWDPCDLNTLSQLTKLENNQLSSQLDRLIKSSWVERTNRFSEEKKKVAIKNKNYSIRERFFNIWYIMRRASRRQRNDLKSLTCFLETFYSPEHLTVEKIRILDIIKNNPDTDKVTYGLALSRAHDRKEQENEMEQEIYRAILEKAEGDQNKIAEYLDPSTIPASLYEEYVVKRGKWVGLLEQLIKAKEFEKAYSLSQAVLKKDETDAYAWGKSGDILVSMNRNVEAEQAYLKAIAAEPSNPYYQFKIAGYWEKAGAFDKAEESYRKVIQLDKTFTHAWSNLGGLLTNLKRYPEAEDILRKGVETNEKDNSSAFRLGLLYWELEKYEEAEEAFKLAVSRVENYAYQWHSYGYILRINKKYEQAEIAYKKAIEIAPDDWSNWRELGDLYNVDLNKYDLAENSYRKAAELAPQVPGIWRRLGTLLNTLKKFDEAEKVYRHVIEIDNTDTSWFALARLLHIGSQKYIEAESAYKKAIELNPQNGIAWGYLGTLYHFQTNQYEDAQVAYRKSLDLQPEIWVFRGSWGDLELDYFKNYIEAEKLYSELIKSGHSAFVFHNYLFLMRDRMKEIEKAKQFFDLNEDKSGDLQDLLLLQRALFALYESNWGIAKENWLKALRIVSEPSSDIINKDWTKVAAITHQLGYGKHLLALFEEHGRDRQFRPFYEGLKALEMGSESYLLNVAEEIREPAKEIYHFMNHYKQ
ncbi:MAG TPA: tetratricopeptide repeat protein [Puia sp.]|nr:tetratricopeptide repeat protein [Puia sp.]